MPRWFEYRETTSWAERSRSLLPSWQHLNEKGKHDAVNLVCAHKYNPPSLREAFYIHAFFVVEKESREEGVLSLGPFTSPWPLIPWGPLKVLDSSLPSNISRVALGCSTVQYDGVSQYFTRTLCLTRRTSSLATLYFCVSPWSSKVLLPPRFKVLPSTSPTIPLFDPIQVKSTVDIAFLIGCGWTYNGVATTCGPFSSLDVVPVSGAVAARRRNSAPLFL